MSTFTDEQGRVFTMDPLTGGYRQVGASSVASPGLRQQAGEAYQKGKTAIKGGIQSGREAAQDFLKRYPNAGAYARGGLALAGSIPAAGTAMEELEAGRPLGAVAALAPAGLSAAGAALIGKGVPGTVAGLTLMGLGAILPGASAKGAEAVRQSVTGKPTKGKEAEFTTQLAMRGQLMDQDLGMLDRSLGIQTSQIKDLTQFYNQAQVEQFKAMAPEIEKAKMNDFARYQSAMALQGRIRGQLNVLQTAGNLAQGQQAGMYNLTATALQNNPYAQIGGIG